MGFDIGPTIGVEGEKEFKKALTEMNSGLKVLGSELKKVSAQFSDNAGSMEALTARQDVLSRSADEQKQKVQALASMLEKAKQEYGENSTQVQNWRVKLNNAETDLAKTESQLRQTTNQIENFGKETNDMGDQMQKAEKKALSFGDVLRANVLSDAIVGGFRALGSAIASMASELGDFIKGGIETASNLQEVQNVVDTTFGDGADTVDAFAKKAANAYGLSELSAKQYSGTLGAMFKSMGLGEQATIDMSTSLTGLAGDMASFYNLSGDEAFAKLRAGISGETEPLKQLGINMSQANLEAFALTQGIGKNWSQMTQAEQATLRYNYIMQATASAQGDFAKTSDSFANQQRILKLNMENLSASIGSKLLPSINGFASALNDLLSGQINASEFGQKIGGTLSGLATIITDSLPGIITAGAEIISKLVEGIRQSVPQIAQGATTIVTQLATTIIESLPQLLLAGQEIIINLAKGIGASLPTLIPAAIDAIITLVDGFIENIDMVIDAAVAIITGLGEGLVEALPKLIEKAPEIIIKLVSALIENAPKLLLAAAELIAQLIIGLAKGFGEIFGKIGSWVYDNIILPIGKKMYEINQVGINLVKGLWEGISSSVSWLLGKIKEWCGSILNGIKSFFGIHSPSTVMAEVGANLGKGMANGIEDSKAEVLSAATDMSNALLAEETRLQTEIAKIQAETQKQTKKTDAEIQEEALNSQLKLVQDFKKQYDDAIKAVQDSQDKMSEKLVAFGELFTKTKTDLGEYMELGNLQSQIDAINAYGNSLEKLKARGVSDSLLEEIQGMSIEDATQYTQKLLLMTDTDYAQYMALWEEKQKAAANVAANFYKKELEALKTEFTGKIPEELSGIKDQMSKIGTTAGQNLAESIYAGFASKMSSVAAQINSTISSTTSTASTIASAVSAVSEGTVNGIASLLGGVSGNSGILVLQTVLDSNVIAQSIYDPLQGVATQKGEAFT